MEHDLSKLKEGTQILNMDITDQQLGKFDKYISLLIQWNKKMNLTAITEPEEIIVDHFLDSISILNEINIEDHHSIIDVGTGAGFPGIPIKIMKPHVKLVLLDSLKKRTEFLKVVAEELGLSNIEIIHSRAEDLAREEKYKIYWLNTLYLLLKWAGILYPTRVPLLIKNYKKQVGLLRCFLDKKSPR